MNKNDDFKLADLENKIIDKIVYQDDLALAYGIVKMAGEAIIVVNEEAPKISRARAMTELMKYAESGAKAEGCYQLQCFVKDQDLAKLLERKFNFMRTWDIVLVKNL